MTILAALIDIDDAGTQIGVTDSTYTNTTGVTLEGGLWYPALSSDVQWSEQARHPYQEQGGELSVGDLVITNESGIFDFIMTADIIGQRVELRRGNEGDAWADMELVFIARTESRRFEGYQVILGLENWLARLADPIFDEAFDADTPNPQLVGKQIPYVLGKVTQAPVLEFDPSQLQYYTAGNASLIGEVAEGGNPTQRWALDDQPKFTLQRSPTLPITATFEGPGDSPNEVLGAVGRFEAWNSDGEPEGWNVHVQIPFTGNVGRRPTITEVSTGAEIESETNDNPSIFIPPTESESVVNTGYNAQSEWTNPGNTGISGDTDFASNAFSGAAQNLKINVGELGSGWTPLLIFRGRSSSGNRVLSRAILYDAGIAVATVPINYTVPTSFVDKFVQLSGFERFAGVGKSLFCELEFSDEGSGTVDVSEITITDGFTALIPRINIFLSRDVSLDVGETFRVKITASSASDPLGVATMTRSSAITDQSQFDYQRIDGVSPAATLTTAYDRTFVADGSWVAFSFGDLDLFGSGMGPQVIESIELFRQGPANTSYKALAPYIIEQAGFTSSEYDQATFDAHADEYGDPEMGWMVRKNESADQVLFRLAGSLFGYVWHGLDGKVRSKRLEAPSETAGAFVIDSARADPQNVIAYDDNAPNLRDSVNALRNWQPLSDDQAAGVTTTWTQEDRAAVLADWRITRPFEADSTTRERFRELWPSVAAREPFPTALRDASTAQRLANDGYTIWKRKPIFYELPVYVDQGELSKVAVGETVKCELDYPGMNGTYMLVLGRAGTAQPGIVNLTLWTSLGAPDTFLAARPSGDFIVQSNNGDKIGVRNGD